MNTNKELLKRFAMGVDELDRAVADAMGGLSTDDVENLYIADTGVFPSCPSVNPMWTAMALAHRTAARISERF